jgi:hypothetical protein
VGCQGDERQSDGGDFFRFRFSFLLASKRVLGARTVKMDGGKSMQVYEMSIIGKPPVGTGYGKLPFLVDVSEYLPARNALP